MARSKPQSLACGCPEGCKFCCYGPIKITPDEAARLTEHHETEFGKLRLNMGEDGYCVYWKDGGCSIYPDRPRICVEHVCATVDHLFNPTAFPTE